MKKAAFFLAAILSLAVADMAQAGGFLNISLGRNRAQRVIVKEQIVVEQVRVQPVIVEQVCVQQVRVQQVKQVRVQPVSGEEIVEVPAVRQIKQVRIERNRLCD